MVNISTPCSKTIYALGTDNIIKIYDDIFPPGCLEEAENRLQEIHGEFSVFDSDSQLSCINKNAGIAAVTVADDVIKVIKTAVKYAEQSQGSFNMLMGPLTNLWRHGKKQGIVPDENKIKSALSLSGCKDIVINELNKSVFLTSEGESLDGGSIVKGFAADEVLAILLNSGIENAIIDFGGNIYALGKKPNNSLWKVGIQHPLLQRGRIMGTVSVSDKAVVTSGNYERFFTVHSKRYHHIIDPKTGYPTKNGLISATVVSSASISADALSTCAYNMGIDDGFDFIEEQKDVDGIFITEDKRVYVTSGLKDNFTLLDDAFMYINKF